MICNTGKKLQRNINLVLKKKNINAAEFDSRGTYVELARHRTLRGFIEITDKPVCERGRVKMDRKRQRERSVPRCGEKSLRLSISCLSISSQDTQCQKRYLTRSSLKQYKAVSDKQQQICQPKRRYQCNKCPKLFSRPFCLKRHQLSHHSVGKSLRLHPKKKYQCKVCHKRLATKSYLKVHAFEVLL